ncbi:unnamed protein product [Brachionus calyciflorus]|uniref:Uncharacterized protein n=1 Tax=Brachionus calyciflorus TaxID=104777 RepID=A0A813X1I7_9BILA|nr:unnamed protein product [Brachionus calyciflorus]
MVLNKTQIITSSTQQQRENESIKCVNNNNNSNSNLNTKLESIELYEKRFLNSLKNLNSTSLLKPNLKNELLTQRTNLNNNKLDLNKPKFLFQNDTQVSSTSSLSSHKSRYDRIRSKSSSTRHKSAKPRDKSQESNLNSTESKSLNLLVPLIRRSVSTNSTYTGSSFNLKTSISSCMSSSNSLNSNWYKPKPLQKPVNLNDEDDDQNDDANEKIMNSQKLELNETKMDSEVTKTTCEEYDNLNTTPEHNLNQSMEDYQQKSNVASFIILNDSINSYNEQSSQMQQVSEDYEDEEMDDNELRTYDDENINNFPEDEFFLISSPSPFALEDTEPIIRQNPSRYEQNRLSNIIEEDDEINQTTSEHEDFKEMLELSKQVTDSYKNIENELTYKPVVKKRVYNLNRTYYETNKNSDEEEPDNILNFLIDKLSEQHKLDLKKFDSENKFDRMEKELLDKYTLPEKDSEFLLTKSLYAKNKVINDNNKLITALSINEIETRRSICFEDDMDLSENDDEKKIKEEIVLIGEKNDIDSFLHNENNQLYNLLMANSNRVSRLSNLEDNLSRKRLSGLKDIEVKTQENDTCLADTQNLSNSLQDVEIEIQIEEPETKGEYETELRDVAKYLVDEITKISLNKVKIDYLNEKYENKNFDVTNLINKEIEEDDSLKNLKDNKQDLIEYYENLEKNLHQVRSEIDKLKQEAVEDLAYLSKILNTDEYDIDEFYLNNDEKTETETEYLSQSNLASSQVYLTPAESFNKNDENTLTNQTDEDEDSENEETKNTVKENEDQELEEEEDDDQTLKNELEDLSHLVKNILTSRPSFKLENLESKFIEPKRQTLHLVDKKSVENLLKLASNSASLINLNIDVNNSIQPIVEAKPAVKPRVVKKSPEKNFENQLNNLIQSAKSNCSTSNFRIPSSRHFCGRLMSFSQNSSVSSSSSSSSSSSASMTNTEISIETDSTESPSPASTSPNSQYQHQRNMAKSVEFLSTKIDDLKKEKSLISLIDSTRPVGVSKSIKDLREFVSNSYSPSQIVRPDSVEPQKRQLVQQPVIKQATSINSLMKPFKNEKSDQIRLEFLQQQQALAKMERDYSKKMDIKKSTNESDETLINCILEMKPLPSNRNVVVQRENVRPNIQPRTNSSQSNNSNQKSLNSSFSLSSNGSNSNRNSINQNENYIKKLYFSAMTSTTLLMCI